MNDPMDKLPFVPDRFQQLRGDTQASPDASVVIPVNAQADLDTVLMPLGDLAQYSGMHRFEVVLVINNYPEGSPPRRVERFRRLGIRVVDVPSARQPGEVVILSARALGTRAARSDVTIHLDADCRIGNVNALLDWYIESVKQGAGVAYSHVGFYDLRSLASVRAKIGIHNLARWSKRNLLRIPTTRGSNYVARKGLFLSLYDEGRLSVDLQVGPAAKLAGETVVYSGRREFTVLTSGRRFRGGWIKMVRYYLYRLRYNWNAVPTRRRAVKRGGWTGFDQESDNRAAM